MTNLKKLWELAQENVEFLGISLLIVLGIFLVAYVGEKLVLRSKGENENQKVSKTKKITLIGMFSAISVVLMLLDIPLWFLPGFYQIDISEVPILICSFLLGPVAGVIAEFCKILLNLALNSTDTAFVGELANFIIGCCLVVPASIIYTKKKTKKNALIGMIVGTVVMVIAGCGLNIFLLLPTYARLFGMEDINAIVAMGTAVNGTITDLKTFVFFAVAPFNLIKGILVSALTMLLYKKISVILKSEI